MMDNYIRGILTNCSTNEKVELDVEYEIEIANSHLESDAKYFRLVVRLFPPPEDLMGYIGFSIDDYNLRQVAKKGWMACNNDENEIEDISITKITKNHKLFFPPEEMEKVFIKENLDTNANEKLIGEIMKEDYRELMKNDNEESPTTLSNESIRKITDILEPEIKCNLLFLEEKGVSLEDIEILRTDVINFIHERVSKMRYDEKYKTRIIVVTYQRLLHTVYSIAKRL